MEGMALLIRIYCEEHKTIQIGKEGIGMPIPFHRYSQFHAEHDGFCVPFCRSNDIQVHYMVLVGLCLKLVYISSPYALVVDRGAQIGFS
ncbi:hypothetical protein HanIR_Chr12g0565041 [Helianthus annuus]|nr:hypothetical protein HanIR_Chr12g0565041 [Helianthus annuus]